MANRQLTKEERDRLSSPLLDEIRSRLVALSDGDEELLWALRRKLSKELNYDERGKSKQRQKRKAKKRAQQDNKCPLCGLPLPAKYAVLDRTEAMKGYPSENTRLICPDCDAKTQEARGYK